MKQTVKHRKHLHLLANISFMYRLIQRFTVKFSHVVYQIRILWLCMDITMESAGRDLPFAFLLYFGEYRSVL